jgi:hypothetical protein
MIQVINRLIVLIQPYIARIHMHQYNIIVQSHIKNKIKIYQNSKIDLKIEERIII